MKARPARSTTARLSVAVIVAGLAGAAFAQEPTGELLESTYRQAEQAFREQRLGDAAEGYAKLAELSPETAEVHAKLGLISYLQGRFRDAIPAFREALELKPALPGVGTLLAISLAELGQCAEALPGLENGFGNPSDRNLQRLVGLELQRCYLGLGRASDAGRITHELGEMYPDDPEILFHAGRFHADMATAAMGHLLAVAPDSVWARQASAEALDSQGHHALAIVEYRKVLKEHPGRPGLHYSIGRAIQSASGDAGSLDDALEEFRLELAVDPSHALAAYEAGEILRKGSRLEEARPYFEQAVAHRPDFGAGRIALGRVLRELGEPEAAKLHLEAATELEPDHSVARYQLALVYRSLGDLAAAQREMEAFQRLDRGPASRPASSGPLPGDMEATPQTPDPLPESR